MNCGAIKSAPRIAFLCELVEHFKCAVHTISLVEVHKGNSGYSGGIVGLCIDRSRFDLR